MNLNLWWAKKPKVLLLLAVLFIASFAFGGAYSPSSATDLYVDCVNGNDGSPGFFSTNSCTDPANPCQAANPAWAFRFVVVNY